MDPNIPIKPAPNRASVPSLHGRHASPRSTSSPPASATQEHPPAPTPTPPPPPLLSSSTLASATIALSAAPDLPALLCLHPSRARRPARPAYRLRFTQSLRVLALLYTTTPGQPNPTARRLPPIPLRPHVAVHLAATPIVHNLAPTATACPLLDAAHPTNHRPTALQRRPAAASHLPSPAHNHRLALPTPHNPPTLHALSSPSALVATRALVRQPPDRHRLVVLAPPLTPRLLPRSRLPPDAAYCPSSKLA